MLHASENDPIRLTSFSPEDERNRATLDISTSDHEKPTSFHKPFPNIAGYEILEELARGGMGIVYKARQTTLNRVVAIKMILSGQFADDVEIQRFYSEAQAAANLRHRNIVAIHEIGKHEGQHFFSMDYIDGKSLAELVCDNPVSARLAAQYVKIVAETMQFAHDHGILHRDLKPSNVLLDSTGTPLITDFGLAKQLEGQSRMTVTGSIVGTPSYMPPEQAAAWHDKVTVRSDVYSIGAVLYELLSGRPPFQATNPFDTIRLVLEIEPIAPSTLVESIPRDLETICLKCLEKDPQNRYHSAKELADELGRFIAGETISARSVNLLERFARNVRHDKLEAAFQRWSIICYLLGVIFLVASLLVTGLRLAGFAQSYVSVTQIVSLVLIFLAVWFARFRIRAPLTSLERQLVAIISGTYVTSFCFYFVYIGIHGWPFDERILYPSFSVLNGLCWLIMGSIYWGRCYVFGAVFLGLSVVMTFNLDLAPAEYGLIWAIVFAIVGRRFGKLRHRNIDILI